MNEHIGFHKNCGGSVLQRLSRGRRPSLRDPGEDDVTYAHCSECGAEDPETVSTEEEAYPEEVVSA